MSRAGVLVSLALLCGACGEPARAPNLLLVVLDTTRADHLACYGGARPTSPTVDALARDGVRFDQAYSQSSLTPVSAATLLTGALPPRHGVRSLFAVGKQTLAADVASLPEMLAASGRRTAAFVSAKPMGAQYGLSRGFETFHDDLSATRERHEIEKPEDAPQRPAEDTADLALEWLDRNGREPFALMVHFFDAHDASFVPPREWLAQHVSFPLPDPLERHGAPTRIPALEELDARIELYDAEILWMDEQLARIVAKLDEVGCREDTLIAVVADHGQGLGEHDFWAHGLLYQEQLRVPLILSGRSVPRGVVVQERVRLVDFLPTIAELFDLAAPSAALDGESLVPAIEGRPHAAEPRSVYAEVQHSAEDRHRRDVEMHSLWVRDWKLIHRPRTGKHELYDLATDPLERINRYAPDHATATALEFRLGQMGALGGETPTLEGLGAAGRAELEKLGYL